MYIPTNSVGGSLFSILTLEFIVCRVFYYVHSDLCEVIPHWSFDLHLSNRGVEHIFMSFLPSVCLLWRNVCLSLCLFFFNFFNLLNWSCLYIYILEINPLLVASFPNIFSLSVGYLFILFIISFAVVFLLSWWYYLSTKIANLDKVQFIFSFVTWAFGVVSEQVLLNPGSQRFIPVFSSKSQFLCTV